MPLIKAIRYLPKPWLFLLFPGPFLVHVAPIHNGFASPLLSLRTSDCSSSSNNQKFLLLVLLVYSSYFMGAQESCDRLCSLLHAGF